MSWQTLRCALNDRKRPLRMSATSTKSDLRRQYTRLVSFNDAQGVDMRSSLCFLRSSPSPPWLMLSSPVTGMVDSAICCGSRLVPNC